MRKRIAFLAGVATMAVLLAALGGPPSATKAFVPPQVQDFDIDLIECLVAQYPPDSVTPDPYPTGATLPPYLSCGTEDKAVGPRDADDSDGKTYSQGVSIEIIEGNRQGMPYIYSGPGWVVKADDPAEYGNQAGDVASVTDLFRDGTNDIFADTSNCGGGSCDPGSPLTLATAVPEQYYVQTINWGAGTGCVGEDESYLDEAMPGVAAMQRYARQRACIDTLFLRGFARIDLVALSGAPTPLNLVYLTPNWSPAGTVVNLVLMTGQPTSPTTSLVDTGSPQSSLSHHNAPYVDNPTTPGLYARWATEISAADEADWSVLNFTYSTSCKAIGGTFTDADADCAEDYTPVGGALPDLMPFGLTAASDSSVPSTTVMFWINNVGGAATTDVDARITFPADPGTCSVWADQGTPAISGTGTTRDVTFTGLTLPACPAAGCDVTIRVSCTNALTGNVTVDVDNDATLTENDETNNSSTTTINQPGPSLDPCVGVADCDGDLLLDGVELAWGSNPTLTDTDGDGRTDLEEMIGPTQMLSDPTNPDTDGDGVLDGGLIVDLNGDGAPDCLDEDGDGKGPGCAQADTDGVGGAGTTPPPPGARPDTGISPNLDTSADGSSHVRVGVKIVGKDIKADGDPTGPGMDNCPSIPNASQVNTDYDWATEHGNGDIYGDACDNDDDQDEIADGAELVFSYDAIAEECGKDPVTVLSNAAVAEVGPSTLDVDDASRLYQKYAFPVLIAIDGELMEVQAVLEGGGPNPPQDQIQVTRGEPGGSAPAAHAAGADVYKVLDPLNLDTDGDCVLDGVECENGSDPSNPNSSPGAPKNPDNDDDGLGMGGTTIPVHHETYQRAQSLSDQRSPRPVGDEDVDGDGLVGDDDPDCDSVVHTRLDDACEALVTGTSLLGLDTDSDGVLDANEPNVQALMDSCCLLPGDLDGDGVPNGGSGDNCQVVANAGQEDTGLIGNGCSLAGDDKTVPWSAGDTQGDACDGDGTYDDSNDGTWKGAGDNGPDWDTNMNSVVDTQEGNCPLSVNPTDDDDGDGLLNTWEVCKWGTDPDNTNSDGDAKGDCVEAADVNGDTVVDFVGDTIAYAKAALLSAGCGAGQYGKDGDFDINGDGVIDFVGDVIQEAKFALGVDPCL